jgi:hypothetical protein
MVCCGWALQALQALQAHPGIWEKGLAEIGGDPLGLSALDGANPKEQPGLWKTSAGVQTWLRRELGGGLRTWEAILDQSGYIPTSIGAGTTLPGVKWDEFSHTGGYAHLISAAAQWLLVLENKRDWEQHHVPALPVRLEWQDREVLFRADSQLDRLRRFPKQAQRREFNVSV